MSQSMGGNSKFLDELIERFGSGAVISVDNYVLDRDHVNTRWVVSIDRVEVPGVDVAIRQRGDLFALALVSGDDEFELYRWNPTNPKAAVKEPVRIVDTLGGLNNQPKA